MTKISKRELAFGIVHNFFEGKKDLAGESYIEHLLYVKNAVSDHGDDYAITALLHDVVEDTEASLEFLRHAGFSDAVVAAVDAITKREGEDYMDYLARVKANEIATVVKLADIKHNSDMSRLPLELRDVTGICQRSMPKQWRFCPVRSGLRLLFTRCIQHVLIIDVLLRQQQHCGVGNPYQSGTK